MSDKSQIQADKELIERLGGTTKVAELLGLDKTNGAQRVNHWMKRGIPAKEKLARPDLFLVGFYYKKPRKTSRRAAERRDGDRRSES